MIGGLVVVVGRLGDDRLISCDGLWGVMSLMFVDWVTIDDRDDDRLCRCRTDMDCCIAARPWTTVLCGTPSIGICVVLHQSI